MFEIFNDKIIIFLHVILSIVITYTINKIITIIFRIFTEGWRLITLNTSVKIKAILRLLLILFELLYIINIIHIGKITTSTNVAIVIFVITYLAKDLLTSIQSFVLLFLNEKINVGDYLSCNCNRKCNMCDT